MGGITMIFGAFGAVRLLEVSFKLDKGDECAEGITDKISGTH